MSTYTSSQKFYCCYQNSSVLFPNLKSVAGFNSRDNSILMKEVWGKKRVIHLNSQKARDNLFVILHSLKTNKLVSCGGNGLAVIVNSNTNKHLWDGRTTSAGKFYAGTLSTKWAILGSYNIAKIFVLSLLKRNIFEVISTQVELRITTSLAYIETPESAPDSGVLILNSEQDKNIEIHTIVFERI